jgi:DNA-binding MarR family transcriptional regulator
MDGTGTARGPLASPGYWLHQAALTWKAELDNALAGLGLTHTQFILLATVGWLTTTGDGPPGQQEVATAAGTDRQMTSRLVRTLEEKALLVRLPHEGNARSFRLELTDTGRALAREAIAVARAVDTRFFGSRSAELREALQQIAEKRSGPAGGREQSPG